MSQEIQVSATLQYTNAANNITAKSLSVVAQLFNITGKNYIAGIMQVPTTADGTAIPVSGLTGLGWAYFKNNDPTNFIDLYSAVAGTLFIRLYPGEVAMFRFNIAVTAPAAIADTAAAPLEYLILEN